MRSSTAVRCLILARVPLLPAKAVVFWQEGFSTVASQPVTRHALVEALADADATFASIEGRNDPAALARNGLLVLPSSSSVRPPAHERAKDVQSWDDRIAVVAEYPIFRDVKTTLSVREKWGTWVSDSLRIMSMIHLRPGVRPV
jgi:hypothetical protein